MNISTFLGKVVGMYLVLVSIAMFINMHQFMSYANNLINNDTLMFVTGFFTLIIGLLMVMSHNIWQWDWRAIITIISWVTLLKGANIILYPHFIDNMTILFLHDTNIAYITAGFDLILGILLCYFGFIRKL